MSDKILLTRNQIAKIVNNNPEAIKAFENLFRVATQLNPNDIAILTKLSEESSLDGNSALTVASNGLYEIEELRKFPKMIIANYEIPSKNATIFADCTSGSITVTMPNPITSIGKSISVSKVDTSVNTLLINPYSTELIAGEASQTLRYDRECLDLVSDGTNWQIGG